MKQNLTLFLAVFCLSVNVFAQKNYMGVTGNMVAGDFDNDGKQDDIAAFNTSDKLPSLTLWTAHNEFIDESEANCRLPFDFLDAKSINSKIVSGDFDNDGFVDDIAAIYEIGYNKTSLTVWINNDGEFMPQQWWYGGDFDANQVAQTIVAGDFDHDGFVDDIVAFYDYGQTQAKAFVWKSNGQKFEWPATWWKGSDFNATRIQGTVVSGDFDHNGFIDDIAAVYNYIDNYTKIFVWTTNKNKFNWPYTWYKQENFAAGKAKNNMVAGDFNNNGFVDNIAALYENDEYSSSILVFERDNKGFKQPETWWYGTDESKTHKMRLVATDFNNNFKKDQITGLSLNNELAKLNTWTAIDRSFSLPNTNWEALALKVENCDADGSCLSNNFNDQFKLYPNPNRGQFTIDLPQTNDELLNIQIVNVLGGLVLNIQSAPGIELPVQLENFKAGSYLLQVRGNDFSLNKIFMVE